MPPLSLSEWLKSFLYYKEASAWGTAGHKTQLAYLRTCISEEIRTAVQLDYLKTVPEALYNIKTYLDMAVMPLTLRQLEGVRYYPPPVPDSNDPNHYANVPGGRLLAHDSRAAMQGHTAQHCSNHRNDGQGKGETKGGQ